MSGGWERSTPDRKSRLPDDWQARRKAVAERAGGRCEMRMANGSRCRDKGTDCDHVKAGDNHSLENLQWICTWHHRKKTAAEGNAARVPKTAKHPGEAHPSGMKFY